jgi:hypothetical protein
MDIGGWLDVGAVTPIIRRIKVNRSDLKIQGMSIDFGEEKRCRASALKCYSTRQVEIYFENDHSYQILTGFGKPLAKSTGFAK